jgi:hypothetical protein
MERRRTLVVIAAMLVGAFVGFFIGGGDWATLRTVFDQESSALDTMSDGQLVELFLPPIVGGLVAAWAANRWMEHAPKNDR